ncbi:lysine exporter LysO family protein [Clostridium tagluense]|uniref:lysine exporter LysO family protein n=1 Tax=Clostridium tagluense TaxID=360422 RepID=UPI001CF2DC12|nr:lysine exporter LysO family protein [Clostridium tagluense]MCB2310430.1 lysine exporter LysO family protein [Clostridium tagluense]MCB2315404.1 lysine exporter LysO family protein [Clostridium tagluense]MCB2320257.1 lysine exporter LysO family protein [Clostridium tagluense]MCB2325146.1 lysine exporter LysO family protein [Clostridium tagluense]MCB2329998.1 lysine exporter LysO family protein [Clostridium tagluense]
MTWLPFFCLGAGLLLGIRKLSDNVLKLVDWIINIALIVLMLTIGMNIGINDSVMLNLGTIGINCAVIAISAIAFSVALVLLVEKTILPLDILREKLYAENLNVNKEVDIDKEKEKKTSPLVWIMPISIVAGIIVGYFLLSDKQVGLLGYTLMGSLIFLYIGVGISLGTNRKVFGYIKILGFKVVYISIAIFVGSILGGLLSGLVLHVPIHISVISASGMSYYSITGAYMTQGYGIESGTYGFVVNVMREFFTVLLLPLLIRISKGSPIAGGAAGNMDTMLVPVTKFVAAEVGLVALITGVILTFAVPFILPFLYGIL